MRLGRAGERGAAFDWSAAYADGLRGLIRQLRDDLKRPDMAVVIGRLNTHRLGQAPWDAVRAAQVRVAEEDPLARWVDTDDLQRGTGMNSVHFVKEAYVELGRRFALNAVAILKAKAERPSAPKAAGN